MPMISELGLMSTCRQYVCAGVCAPIPPESCFGPYLFGYGSRQLPGELGVSRDGRLWHRRGCGGTGFGRRVVLGGGLRLKRTRVDGR